MDILCFFYLRRELIMSWYFNQGKAEAGVVVPLNSFAAGTWSKKVYPSG